MKPLKPFKKLMVLFAIGLTTLFYFSHAVQAASGDHQLFIQSNGTVKASGSNEYGQLGNGTTSTTYQNVPVSVTGLTDVVMVAEGGAFLSLALKSDGTVWAWGRNDFGQLGDGTDKYNSTVPQQVPGLSCIVQITAGAYHVLALQSDGTVMSWGANAELQLGYPTVNWENPNAVQIPGLTNVKKIMAAGHSSFALMQDGTIKAWGLNNYGQLGKGTTSFGDPVSQIPGLTGVIDLDCNNLHCIALLSDHSIRTWGHNMYGQLGTGNTTDSHVPVSPLIIGNDVVMIAASGYTTMALLADGTLMGWGYNMYGQLANCGYATSLSPIITGIGLSGIIDIDQGYYSTSFYRNDGTVIQFGDNYYGQLGDGTYNNTCTGVSPIGLTSVKPNRNLYLGQAFAGDDVAYCTAGHPSIQLGTTYCDEGISYSWLPTTGLSSSTISNPVVNINALPPGSTTYTLTMVTGSGTTTDEVIITRLPEITLGTQLNPQTQYVCNSTPTTINTMYLPSGGNGSYTYLWIPFGGAPIGALNDPTILNPVFTYATPGVYQYSVQVKSPVGCTISYTRFIDVRSAPAVPNFNYETEVCDLTSDADADFAVVSPQTSIGYTYSWNFGNGTTATGTSVNVNLGGGVFNITLTVTDMCGRTNSFTRQLEYTPTSSTYNQSCCTDNNNLYPLAYQNDYTVNASNTSLGILSWNNLTRYVKKTIYIESGYTLSISNSTIRFGMKGRIVVKPGGRLLVTNNSVLAAIDSTVSGVTCKGMWQGIEVWGNENYSQSGAGLAQQGKATLSVNSQVRDAHKAIFVGRRNWCYDMPGSPCASTTDYVATYGGGIVDVQNCVFKRNGVDIQFTPYTDPNTALTSPSIVKGNTFEGGKTIDPSYNLNDVDGSVPYPNQNNKYYAPANTNGRTPKHIQIYRLHGLTISDNVFDSAEYGIDGKDAKFNVTRVTLANGNDFRNLAYGIFITHTTIGVTYPHQITENKFNKVKLAISISGGSGDVIFKNNFGQSGFPASSQTDNVKGISFDRTSAFAITDNQFFRLDTAVEIINSGSGGGQINSDPDGNLFTRCKTGIRTSGNNSNLQIRCNRFTYSGTTGGEYINRNWDISGTLANQGTASQPAGNEFLTSTSKDIYSTVAFTYYRHSQSFAGTQSVTPTVATGSATITITNTGIAKTEFYCDPTPPCTPPCDSRVIKTEQDPFAENRDHNGFRNSHTLNVYPNPSTDLLHISYNSDEEDGTIELFDLLGRSVQQAKLNKGYQLLEMNISDLQGGTYVLQVKNSSGNIQAVRKIIVQ